jgi:hypothetical protein
VRACPELTDQMQFGTRAVAGHVPVVTPTWSIESPVVRVIVVVRIEWRESIESACWVIVLWYYIQIVAQFQCCVNSTMPWFMDAIEPYGCKRGSPIRSLAVLHMSPIGRCGKK